MARNYNSYNNTADFVLRDWQHAARLYVDDLYRLAPKPKWMFYAVFNLDPSALTGTPFQGQNRNELNYLVKRMDLPRYTLDIENLNQYNRKTTSYKRINYDPVNIVFHDDNNGVTNAIWAMYYSHFFADRLNSSSPYTDINPPAYQRHTYDPKSAFPFRYGLDVSTSINNFFTSVQLITLTKHKFTSYLLCYPRITSWQHDTVDQSEGNGTIENNMTLAYDAVIYTTGTIDVNNPSGFATLHYDTTPSPLVGDGVSIFNNLNQNFAPDLFSQNPFNPIDLGISVLAANRQLSIPGNRAPFGFNNSGPILPNVLSNVVRTNPLNTTSGFQNYSFGGIENTNLTQERRIPSENFYNVSKTLVSQGINSQFASTSNNTQIIATNVANVPSNPITTDVYALSLPSDKISSTESKIFSGFGPGGIVKEPPGAVNLEYFNQEGVTNTSVTNAELIQNNPLLSDIPDDPFL